LRAAIKVSLSIDSFIPADVFAHRFGRFVLLFVIILIFREMSDNVKVPLEAIPKTNKQGSSDVLME